MILLLITLASYTAHSKRAQALCEHGDPCWPKRLAWARFNRTVNGRLVKGEPQFSACAMDQNDPANIAACDEQRTNAANPYKTSYQPGGFITLGMYDNVERKFQMPIPPVYAVNVSTSQEISDTVKWAVKNNIRLTIKGASHEFLMRNNAPSSLLIWTRNMNHLDFLPDHEVCGETYEMITETGAGNSWFYVYKEATARGWQPVGGQAPSVGVAGWNLGGGFGQTVKLHGGGAQNIVEMEVIKADGSIVTANACQNSDLFWAMRGGGGSTFGVMSKMKLKSYRAPKNFWYFTGSLYTANRDKYKDILAEFFIVWKEHLMNPYCGGFIYFWYNEKTVYHYGWCYGDITLEEVQVKVSALGAVADMDPEWMTDWNPEMVTKLPDGHYNGYTDMDFVDTDGPDAAVRLGAFYLPDDPNGAVWASFNTANVPMDEIKDEESIREHAAFLTSIFETGAGGNFCAVQTVKAMGGGSEWATDLSQTAMNPHFGTSYGAFYCVALSNQASYVPQAPSNPTNVASNFPMCADAVATGDADLIKQCHDANFHDFVDKKRDDIMEEGFKMARERWYDYGTYYEQASYNEPDWCNRFFGVDNCQRLKEIKAQVDPNNVFTCHQCIGDEEVAVSETPTMKPTPASGVREYTGDIYETALCQKGYGLPEDRDFMGFNPTDGKMTNCYDYNEGCSNTMCFPPWMEYSFRMMITQATGCCVWIGEQWEAPDEKNARQYFEEGIESLNEARESLKDAKESFLDGVESFLDAKRSSSDAQEKQLTQEYEIVGSTSNFMLILAAIGAVSVFYYASTSAQKFLYSSHDFRKIHEEEC